MSFRVRVDVDCELWITRPLFAFLYGFKMPFTGVIRKKRTSSRIWLEVIMCYILCCIQTLQTSICQNTIHFTLWLWLNNFLLHLSYLYFSKKGPKEKTKLNECIRSNQTSQNILKIVLYYFYYWIQYKITKLNELTYL